MEPVTLIVTAIALGAAAGLQATSEQTIKDAYSALKWNRFATAIANVGS